MTLAVANGSWYDGRGVAGVLSHRAVLVLASAYVSSSGDSDSSTSTRISPQVPACNILNFKHLQPH